MRLTSAQAVAARIPGTGRLLRGSWAYRRMAEASQVRDHAFSRRGRTWDSQLDFQGDCDCISALFCTTLIWSVSFNATLFVGDLNYARLDLVEQKER
jgi:hypothetical protein